MSSSEIARWGGSGQQGPQSYWTAGSFPDTLFFLLSWGSNLEFFFFHIPTENVVCSCSSGKEFCWLSPAALLSPLWLLETWQRQLREDCKACKDCNLPPPVLGPQHLLHMLLIASPKMGWCYFFPPVPWESQSGWLYSTTLAGEMRYCV